MKKIGLIICACILLLGLSQNGKAQVIQESGDLFLDISTIISNMPSADTGEYQNPDAKQLNSWSSLLDHLLLGNYSIAADTANSLGYQLVEYLDQPSGITYYLLRTNSSNYWGTYVYNPNYCRPLVVQSPHPKKDFNTGKQGLHVFQQTAALFFCLSGTNRCNSTDFSSCDGSTSVCSSNSQDYRISDLAHNLTNLFQKTTEVLLNTFDDSHFIQLHGFSKSSSDPYIIFSNGTQETPPLDYISLFENNLVDEDNSLTFKIAHIDLTWTRLRGFTNTQGRLINASADPCDDNATSTSGRFIHMEQEKTKLRDDSEGWDKVGNALKNTFSCLPVATKDLNGQQKNKVKIYPNPSFGFITLEGQQVDFNSLEIYNVLGQKMESWVRPINPDQQKIILDLSALPVGHYFVKTSNSISTVYFSP